MMNDVNGMMKYSAVNRYGKYYSRKNRSERKSTKTPLGNLITNDGVNQQDGKENSVHMHWTVLSSLVPWSCFMLAADLFGGMFNGLYVLQIKVTLLCINFDFFLFLCQ